MFKMILTLQILLGCAVQAHAEFGIPGYELVHTVPLETTLTTPDLREPLQVWREMFDAAREEIDLGQFYVAGKSGEAFDQVIERLDAAGRRGVKIRFLMEEKGKFASDIATIEQLQRIPNLTFRYLNYSKLTGNGIIHAKYMLVDGTAAYVGSQNFDWRAFAHIHETGLRITDSVVVKQLQQIFEFDWHAQALIAQGLPVLPSNQALVLANEDQAAYLVASPNAFNPAGVGDSETELPKLLAAATSEVKVQLLDYAPLSYGPNHTHSYYAVIDNAIRAALARGVKIQLMVSHWNTGKPAIDYLKSLALLPGMEIKIVTLPQASTGFIPFARVIHSKIMSIDGQVAWIGTSNWSGGYMDKSRNLEIILRNKKMAKRIADLHQQTWDSIYAQPIDVMKNYPPPKKGTN
ncbi:phospholipase D-like domain-containing protein [Glaciimonas immobilis]|uniref:Phosphatidylserine/phosphatidylglycerophosphate/ cardiolipin synthase-like enzyme n=1 Tax=Glaciimonas immobilis TaxID=728004 RepID=A0A840RT95_9BURK|nr:phospholipase D-like domain-containing protein [Glaciimonas immobilis]KAF3996585.1 phospholipase [Glaciimonas immobilis]MBB5201045.1 phosphatidylserine/phosphatidylglycerophosphate/cardiolipin synthase-like enzyme [Glaciimonas immobilis]